MRPVILKWCIYLAGYLQVVVIREKLAELYEFEQQWSRAAQMLSGIDLDSGVRYKQSFCLSLHVIGYSKSGKSDHLLKNQDA